MRTLKSASDKELLNNLSKLVTQEREHTIEILLHIIEVENRKVYRALGYRSMFEYCTGGLGYSESSAQRRICAARAIRKCPEANDYFCDGRVNLCNLAISSKYISPNLLEEIAGKSRRQVLNIIARFEPKVKHTDITRPVMIVQPVSNQRERPAAGASSNGSSGRILGAPEHEKSGENHLRCGGKKLATDEKSTPPKTGTVKMHHVNCFLDDAVMNKLERCKELLSGKHPCGMDLNTLLSELASTWLDKNDPIERDKRRRKRAKSSKIVSVKKSAGRSRHISAKTRDAVYKRDGGRCAYIGSNGKRCGSKWDVEIHHDGTPFARGGSHAITNLKLLCAAHNKLESEQVYGRDRARKYKRQIE